MHLLGELLDKFIWIFFGSLLETVQQHISVEG